MSRPTEDGLKYYPMDVGFLRDKKVKLLRAEFGASSVVFVLYVFSKVYEGNGYFLLWDKDEMLLTADELKETPTYISEVVRGCLSRSLFDERVFREFGVLTSAGIQRRYLRGCEKRGEITIINEYWLLDINNKKDVPASIRTKLAFSSITGGISGEKTSIIPPETPENSPGNPQSKVKKSKVKESRVVSGGAPPPAPVSVEEIAEYALEIGSHVDPQEWWDYYAARGWMMGQSPMKDWRSAFRLSQNWERWKKNDSKTNVRTSTDYDSGDSFV